MHRSKPILLFVFSIILFAGLSCKGGKSAGQEGNSTTDTTAVWPLWEEVTLEILDSSVLNLLAAEPLVQKLGAGYSWPEGPVWVESEEMLLFTDVPENVIYSWDEENGARVYLEKSGYTGAEEYSTEQGANGLIIDATGQLVMCQHGNRAVARMEASLKDPKPEYSLLVSDYQGKAFNSPNDLCLSKDGNIYFTDPPYGLPGQENSEIKELDFQGVYQWNPDSGLELIYDGLTRPNGIALSPDESHLYVANSDHEKALWMVFERNEEGRFVDGRVFYDATANLDEGPGLPDGLKVDQHGNIFATGPGGVWIFNPSLEPLGILKVGQPMANCALDEKRGWLYMTANDYLLRAKLNTAN
ncbi:MAG: SMP-30/gluconolactonase/LRE family protein [Bacteroidetes bacterium]|nr:MAG: SMP-30/gluconolactonase/LRE family protein [Bacteroidota bacterium]